MDFYCRETGLNCDHRFQGKTVDETLFRMCDHMRQAHHLEVTQEMAYTVRKMLAVKEAERRLVH